jgi:hypothetical protein
MPCAGNTKQISLRAQITKNGKEEKSDRFLLPAATWATSSPGHPRNLKLPPQKSVTH